MYNSLYYNNKERNSKVYYNCFINFYSYSLANYKVYTIAITSVLDIITSYIYFK